MAKCIKYKNETYARLPDDVALGVVLSGAAMYTSKAAYHDWLGNTNKAVRAGVARLNKIKNKIEPVINEKRRARKQRSHNWMPKYGRAAWL